MAYATDVKYELKKKLKFLKELKGSGTELISVYIPPKTQISEISNKLKQEASQATNIKSKSTRKNVGEALTKLIHHLKIYNKPPENGIALFCGNVSNDPSKTTVELYTVIPPEAVDIQAYRCDSKFFLEPLERLVEIKDVYGITVLDGKDATLAYVKGTVITILKRIHSLAPSKTHKGGQSSARYDRLAEEGREKYLKRVGEYMDSFFVKDGVKGVIVGGPGPAKEDLLKASPFNYQIKILGKVNTGYNDEYGVREVLNQSSEIIKGHEIIVEKKFVDRFIKGVVTNGLVAYGEKEVRESLDIKKANMLLISEGLKYKRINLICENCKKEKYLTIKPDQPIPDLKCTCGGRMKQEREEDLIDNLIDLAHMNNIEVFVVSTDTSEGAQFLNSFYGIGAFLRYR